MSCDNNRSRLITDGADDLVDENFNRIKLDIDFQRNILKTEISKKIDEYSNELLNKLTGFRRVDLNQAQNNHVRLDTGSLDNLKMEEVFGVLKTSNSMRTRRDLDNLKILKTFFSLQTESKVLIEELTQREIVICNENLIEVWDLETSQVREIRTNLLINCLKVNAPNEILISSIDGTIEVWNKNSLTRLDSFSDSSDDQLGFNHFPIEIWKNNGKDFIICGGLNIRVLDKETISVEKVFDQVLTISFKVVEMTKLLACSTDVIKLWDLLQGTCLMEILDDSNEFKSFDVLSTNELITLDKRDEVKIWTMPDGDCKRIVSVFGEGINHVVVLNEDVFLTSTHGAILRLWDKDSSGCLAKQNCWDDSLVCMKMLTSGCLILFYKSGKFELIQ